MDIASLCRDRQKGADAMMITPEKKREIDNEITKFVQHLTAVKRERLDRAELIDLKDFDFNLDFNTHPQQASVTTR